MPRKHVPTLREWSHEWMAVRESEVRPTTFSNYQSNLRLHLLPQLGDKRLDQITVWDIKRAISATQVNSKVHQGVKAPGAVNAQRTYALLRMMLNAAVEAEHIDSHKARVKGLARDASAPRPDWSFSDYKRVRKTLTVKWQDVADVTLGAALRRGETIGLVWGDWNPETEVLHVQRQSDGTRIWDTKTGVAGKVEVLGIAADVLHRIRPPWATPDMPVFPGARSQRLGKHVVDAAWGKARRIAEREAFHFHDLRHLGCTIYAQSGATTAEVMAFGRHRDQAVAARYQHVGDASRRARIRATADETIRQGLGE